MAAASISPSGSAAGLSLDDYSLYSNLSDDELLQLAIERSLTDTPCNPSDTNTAATATAPPYRLNSSSLRTATKNPNRPTYSSHNPPPAQTTAHYSSPNPPREKPPDPYVSTIFCLLHVVSFENRLSDTQDGLIPFCVGGDLVMIQIQNAAAFLLDLKFMEVLTRKIDSGRDQCFILLLGPRLNQ